MEFQADNRSLIRSLEPVIRLSGKSGIQNKGIPRSGVKTAIELFAKIARDGLAAFPADLLPE
jgi:hypothetical protein